MVDSSQTRLAYITEVTYGTTPATPAWNVLRYTGEGLKASRQNLTSNEIRADRNVSDLVQVGGSAAGPISGELSYGTYDEFFESLLQSAWSSNVLKNGSTRKSFSLEKTFEGGATDFFHRYTGAMVNNFGLSFSAGSEVKVNFDMMCKGSSTDDAIVTDATYVAANENPVMNAATFLREFEIGGNAVEVTAFTMNVTNNLRQQAVCGSIESRGLGAGRFQVNGSIDIYFASQTEYDLFLAGTATDLTFTLGGATALNYKFDLGTLKFDDGEILNPGNDQDIFVRFSYVGLYDSSDAATLKITRDPS